MRTKARLTVTLSHDLVHRLDSLIDKVTIRSRSQAVEMLLRQGLAPEVETAILLAGGRRNAGGSIPALTPVCGRPLIAVTLEHLASHGIRNFVVMAGRSEREVRACLGDARPSGATIRYITEELPLGTAGALRRAAPILGPGPLLVVNADILTDIDITSFVAFHVGENTMATMAVKPRQAEHSSGKVVLEGNRIVSFSSSGRSDGISIVSTGVYLFQREVLPLLEELGATWLETDVFPHLAGLRELGAFFFQGIWFDVSTAENRELAEARWRQNGGCTHAHRS